MYVYTSISNVITISMSINYRKSEDTQIKHLLFVYQRKLNTLMTDS